MLYHTDDKKKFTLNHKYFIISNSLIKRLIILRFNKFWVLPLTLLGAAMSLTRRTTTPRPNLSCLRSSPFPEIILIGSKYQVNWAKNLLEWFTHRTIVYTRGNPVKSALEDVKRWRTVNRVASKDDGTSRAIWFDHFNRVKRMICPVDCVFHCKVNRQRRWMNHRFWYEHLPFRSYESNIWSWLTVKIYYNQENQ